MISYVTIGTNDLDKSLAFYDALLGTLGAKRLMEIPDHNGFTLYGTGLDRPTLAVTMPYDGGTASAGNGAMVALGMKTRAEVNAFYAKAMELGASDEGAPGLRGPEGPDAFYGAYFRDPDGNKFCAVKFGADG